jgi:hypothetical protein
VSSRSYDWLAYKGSHVIYFPDAPILSTRAIRHKVHPCLIDKIDISDITAT